VGDETVAGDISAQSDMLAKSRDREAALQEILDVIARSRNDEAPVFDAILKNARRLCEAPMAGLVLGRATDDYQILAAHHGAKDSTVELYRSRQYPMDPEVSFAAKAIVEGEVIHLADMADTAAYREGNPYVRSAVDDQGIRTNLFVPLIATDGAIGCLILFRKEVRPYTDSQIALVKTFATQAVIAIENVRQFRELQTRLEREAATGEILGAISQYRDDDIPVFEAILENAARLCKAPHAFLQLRNEADTHLEVAAQNFATSSFLDLLRTNPIPIHDNEGSISVRGMNAATPTQYDDIRLLKGTEL